MKYNFQINDKHNKFSFNTNEAESIVKMLIIR